MAKSLARESSHLSWSMRGEANVHVYTRSPPRGKPKTKRHTSDQKTNLRTYTDRDMHVCAHTYVRTPMYVCRMCMYVCMRTYVRTYICTYVLTNICSTILQPRLGQPRLGVLQPRHRGMHRRGAGEQQHAHVMQLVVMHGPLGAAEACTRPPRPLEANRPKTLCMNGHRQTYVRMQKRIVKRVLQYIPFSASRQPTYTCVCTHMRT